MFIIALIVIVALSVLFAFISLKKELRRTEGEKAQEVQKSLEKGRVIFYSPTSSSSKS